MSTSPNSVCPVCGASVLRPVVEISNVPVVCNQLYETREQALSAALSGMHLVFCPGCGHMYNAAFDPEHLAYTQAYENSLHFSARFQEFAEQLGEHLIREFGLRGKQIVEVGCGKGEFLELLCRMGGNRGVGFDKSYEPREATQGMPDAVRFINDFYSPKYAEIEADCLVCRHVLEHIHQPGEFLEELRSTCRGRGTTAIYFEVPNAMYTLEDLGIWDLIYEHCSYFTESSLSTLFARHDFEVTRVEDAYGGQFLSLFGYVPARGDRPKPDPVPFLKKAETCVRCFGDQFRSKVDGWNEKLSSWSASGKRVVVWGGGSKGITFLNTVESASAIDYLVDINPRKHGKFVPGTGQQVIGSEDVARIAPNIVIVMNPLYGEEIRSMLAVTGTRAELAFP